MKCVDCDKQTDGVSLSQGCTSAICQPCYDARTAQKAAATSPPVTSGPGSSRRTDAATRRERSRGRSRKASDKRKRR